jgi:hypothetical protein
MKVNKNIIVAFCIKISRILQLQLKILLVPAAVKRQLKNGHNSAGTLKGWFSLVISIAGQKIVKALTAL